MKAQQTNLFDAEVREVKLAEINGGIEHLCNEADEIMAFEALERETHSNHRELAENYVKMALANLPHVSEVKMEYRDIIELCIGDDAEVHVCFSGTRNDDIKIDIMGYTHFGAGLRDAAEKYAQLAELLTCLNAPVTRWKLQDVKDVLYVIEKIGIPERIVRDKDTVNAEHKKLQLEKKKYEMQLNGIYKMKIGREWYKKYVLTDADDDKKFIFRELLYCGDIGDDDIVVMVKNMKWDTLIYEGQYEPTKNEDVEKTEENENKTAEREADIAQDAGAWEDDDDYTPEEYEDYEYVLALEKKNAEYERLMREKQEAEYAEWAEYAA